MPLHDFTCRRCAHTFEALVRAGSPVGCPSCGAQDLEQLPSSFAPSSAGIRKAHVTSARKHAEQARAERRHTDHQYMKKHLHDDH